MGETGGRKGDSGSNLPEKVEEPITQENLPQALKDGRISQREVDSIWRDTEFLSPQTPIEVRRAVVALKKGGHDVSPVEQVLLQVMMDLRASLYRDEAKFSHLVAGTEAIVDKLNAINKWEMLVENLSAKVDELTMTINGQIEERRGEQLPADDDPNDPYGPGAKPINFDNEPYVAEPEPEEEYDRKIGSNWDEKNPRKR